MQPRSQEGTSDNEGMLRHDQGGTSRISNPVVEEVDEYEHQQDLTDQALRKLSMLGMATFENDEDSYDAEKEKVDNSGDKASGLDQEKAKVFTSAGNNTTCYPVTQNQNHSEQIDKIKTQDQQMLFSQNKDTSRPSPYLNEDNNDESDFHTANSRLRKSSDSATNTTATFDDKLNPSFVSLTHQFARHRRATDNSQEYIGRNEEDDKISVSNPQSGDSGVSVLNEEVDVTRSKNYVSYIESSELIPSGNTNGDGSTCSGDYNDIRFEGSGRFRQLKVIGEDVPYANLRQEQNQERQVDMGENNMQKEKYPNHQPVSQHQTQQPKQKQLTEETQQIQDHKMRQQQQQDEHHKQQTQQTHQQTQQIQQQQQKLLQQQKEQQIQQQQIQQIQQQQKEQQLRKLQAQQQQQRHHVHQHHHHHHAQHAHHKPNTVDPNSVNIFSNQEIINDKLKLKQHHQQQQLLSGTLVPPQDNKSDREDRRSSNASLLQHQGPPSINQSVSVNAVKMNTSISDTTLGSGGSISNSTSATQSSTCLVNHSSDSLALVNAEDDLPEGISRPLYVPAVIRKTEETINLQEYYINMKEKQRKLQQQQLLRQQQLQAQQQQQQLQQQQLQQQQSHGDHSPIVPGMANGIIMKLKKKTSGSSSQPSSLSSTSPINVGLHYSTLGGIDHHGRDIGNRVLTNYLSTGGNSGANSIAQSPVDAAPGKVAEAFDAVNGLTTTGGVDGLQSNNNQNGASNLASSGTLKRFSGQAPLMQRNLTNGSVTSSNASLKLQRQSASPMSNGNGSHGNLVQLVATTFSHANREQVSTANWKPDGSTRSCFGCTREFNLLVRKHHCRKCGEIFCDQCLMHKVKLDYDLNFKVFGLNESMNRVKMGQLMNEGVGWEVKACDRCFKKYQLFLQEKFNEMTNQGEGVVESSGLKGIISQDQLEIRKKDPDAEGDDDGYDWSTF